MWRRILCCGEPPQQAKHDEKNQQIQVLPIPQQKTQKQQTQNNQQQTPYKQQQQQPQDQQQQQQKQYQQQYQQQQQQQQQDDSQSGVYQKQSSGKNGKSRSRNNQQQPTKQQQQTNNSQPTVQNNRTKEQSNQQEDPYQRYEWLKDLGSGNFGVARLMRDKSTGKLVAVKFLERGDKIDKNVEREIINHRSLRHPNIVQFREVFLTNEHLGIVMEFAAGGELFDRIVKAGRFTEDEARYFFQQLLSGVEYCHKQGICHRDLKLENSLLDGSPAPILKICDFGYSKSSMFDSQPKSTVGTPAYIAPEVLSRQKYDGYSADVWSCGVTLYVMLVGAYPFEDPQDPRNFRKTIQRIMQVKYSIPSNIRLTKECLDLLNKIFVTQPSERITVTQIKEHAWFLKNLPDELKDGYQSVINQIPESQQREDDISNIIEKARLSPYKQNQDAVFKEEQTGADQNY